MNVRMSVWKKLSILAMIIGWLMLLFGVTVMIFSSAMIGITLMILGTSGGLSGLLFILFHNLRLHTDILERQTFSLHSAIALHGGEGSNRPVFLRHAAAPDFIELLAEIIRRRSITRVLELGCGTTSIYLTSWLPSAEKGGEIVCLEENLAWAQLLQSEIGILTRKDRPLVTVIHAPLVPVPGFHTFYDLTVADFNGKPPFEMLIVDGPSVAESRKGAFPLLRGFLSPSSVVVLDDGDHPSTHENVSTWLSQAPSWKSYYYPTVKGTWILWDTSYEWKLPLP